MLLNKYNVTFIALTVRNSWEGQVADATTTATIPIRDDDDNDDKERKNQERRTSFLLFQVLPFAHNTATPSSAGAALTTNPYFPSVHSSSAPPKKKHPNERCWRNNTTTHNNKPIFRGWEHLPIWPHSRADLSRTAFRLKRRCVVVVVIPRCGWHDDALLRKWERSQK